MLKKMYEVQDSPAVRATESKSSFFQTDLIINAGDTVELFFFCG